MSMYIGKGYELDAVIELRKALPNLDIQRENHRIIIDGGRYEVLTDVMRYGYLREFESGQFVFGMSVERISDIVEHINSNK